MLCILIAECLLFSLKLRKNTTLSSDKACFMHRYKKDEKLDLDLKYQSF